MNQDFSNFLSVMLIERISLNHVYLPALFLETRQFVVVFGFSNLHYFPKMLKYDLLNIPDKCKARIRVYIYSLILYTTGNVNATHYADCFMENLMVKYVSP